MAEYTEGVSGDGAAILKDGNYMTVSEILHELQAGSKVVEAAVALCTDERLPGYRVFTLNAALKEAAIEYQEAT